METINIGKLKQSLSEIVRRVRAGERFTVLDRRTPVAIITAVDREHLRIFSAASQRIAAPAGIEKRVLGDAVAMLRQDRDRR